MKNQKTPRLITQQTGESFKIYQITGQKGMEMPLHHSTKEAVIVVKRGSAHLKMDDARHVLHVGNALVIPPKQDHSLTITEKFNAVVIMPVDSEIVFVE